jgi:hypothetical protein
MTPSDPSDSQAKSNAPISTHQIDLSALAGVTEQAERRRKLMRKVRIGAILLGIAIGILSSVFK